MKSIIWLFTLVNVLPASFVLAGKCQPGTVTHKGCDTCACAENGIEHCYFTGCIRSKTYTEEETKDPNFKCEPGSIFEVDCNTCNCDDSGKISACTQVYCPPKVKINSRRQCSLKTYTEAKVNDPNFRCAPGEPFKVNCNYCGCGDDEKVGYCSTMNCPDETDDNKKYKSGQGLTVYTEKETREPNFKCEPNKPFKIECNFCACEDDGKITYCTLLPCKTESTNPEFIYPASIVDGPNFKCEPGRPFYKDCNLCICSDDAKTSACTLKKCSGVALRETKFKMYTAQEIADPIFTCEPGEKFMRECNNCICSPDGKTPTCTIMKCKIGQTESEINNPDYVCEPFSEFYVECNKCFCFPDGKTTACTNRPCNNLPKSRYNSKFYLNSQICP